jgi:uncharacterized protein (UPF0303 family)
MAEDYTSLLAALLAQEERLQFDSFSNAMALDIGLRLEKAARDMDKAITIDISRNGQQLFQHAMQGTTTDNADWIRRKNNVVQRFAHSSFYIGQHYRSRGTTFEAHAGLDPMTYAAHGGSFPLIIKGTGMIGTITVSGLPQAEDHALVVAVLTDFLS